MSTRATYQFDARYTPTITIYIHHDGYPEGAASYFYRLLCHPNRRGCMATRIIRAVNRSELTGTHATHGDTEYRYNVTGNDAGASIHVLKRYGWGDSEKWSPLPGSPNTLAAFIDQYINAEWVTNIGGYHPFRRIENGGICGGTPWKNVTTARSAIEGNGGSALDSLRVWATKPDPMTPEDGTWRSVAERVIKLAQAFGFDDVIAEVAALTKSLPKRKDCQTQCTK